MHHQFGIGESFHHDPGAAGMVEMDMGEDHVVHRIRAEAARFERSQRLRHDLEVGGIDKGRAALAFDQVNRRQQRPDIACIKGVDAVVVVDQH